MMSGSGLRGSISALPAMLSLGPGTMTKNAFCSRDCVEGIQISDVHIHHLARSLKLALHDQTGKTED